MYNNQIYAIYVLYNAYTLHLQQYNVIQYSSTLVAYIMILLGLLCDVVYCTHLIDTTVHFHLPVM